MSYQVLALKSRPKTFDEVVGQSTVTRTLRNAIATGRIGHAFLLSGARGVGKTSTARILARALNCSAGENPTPDPCGECPSCREIAAGRSLDVQEIDGATHNGVEQVRELRESARYNPARDRYKIWIIDEVHMLSTGAFNALLKTLEEPPPRVKFIFATTEYHKIPDTILSRCQQYDLRMIPAKDLLAHLRKVAGGENVRISDEALSHIVQAAERPREACATPSRFSTRSSPSPTGRSATRTSRPCSDSSTVSCSTRLRRACSRTTAASSSTWSSAFRTTGSTTGTSLASSCSTIGRSWS
jgi:DNA polymerase-3 subunit gamma/tau